MYDWLNEAIENSSEVVTASRRLARVLAEHYAGQQVAAGASAWRSPAILSLHDWLVRNTDSVDSGAGLPARLSPGQCRVLWEKCLAAHLRSPVAPGGALVRQAIQAWTRMHDFGVSLDDLRESVRSIDQRVFANAASDYAATLERENWTDAAGLAGLVTRRVQEGECCPGKRIVFAGFDRFTPAEDRLRAALSESGGAISDVAAKNPAGGHRSAGFETADSELRAAGAWARGRLVERPGTRVAIVSIHLERDADRQARLVREGLAPGWQTGGEGFDEAVNVSYGRSLARFPAVAVALEVLEWLYRDIDTAGLSRLLRSSCIGKGEITQRARLEIELRALPSMNWSPDALVGAFRTDPGSPSDFLGRVADIGQRRDRRARRQSPARWAVLFDEVLAAMNWPGDASLDSDDFQLINRWRELLNELSRLELVSPDMTAGEALARIRVLASETVFQPESGNGGVQLMGPLEAAGMEFDALWVAGLSSGNWPPQGNASPLLSRQLQRTFEMPDFEPADTLEYAGRVLRRLAGSAGEVIFSYPLMDGDAEQSPSGLLREFAGTEPASARDPGWYASSIVSTASPGLVADDPVPRVDAAESVKGGTATIQRQLTDPFSAFAFGRLGVRAIPRLSYGLPASLRGRIVHRALAEFYRDIASQDALRSLPADALEKRSADAARSAVAMLGHRSDSVVRELLALERQRIIGLLHAVAESDLAREPFDIVGLEAALTLAAHGIEMALRVDRMDRDRHGLVILDYKTGQKRKFLARDREPGDMQLVAYACAVDEPVSGLALVNVDSRQVDINGVGRELTPDLDWQESLGRWRAEVTDAVERLCNGDIRLNAALPVNDRRQFGLLSRIQELDHAG